MTLVLTVNGPETIWVLVDRRLTCRGRALKENARKIMFLETSDGVAILAYTGLGATAVGTEPADWMSSVLRGHRRTLLQSLGALARALKRELPAHVVGVPGRGAFGHSVVVPAFLDNEIGLYSIDMAFGPDRKNYQFRYTRHAIDRPSVGMLDPPRFTLAGSGGLYLAREMGWRRDLLRMIKAHDRGQVSAKAVTLHLAGLNKKVHAGITDGSVGPRCIVAWRNKKNGVHKGGGGHRSFTGTEQDATTPSLPTIANGMDMTAISEVIMPQMVRLFEVADKGGPLPQLDKDEINAELARLPDKPDERLR